MQKNYIMIESKDADRAVELLADISDAARLTRSSNPVTLPDDGYGNLGGKEVVLLSSDGTTPRGGLHPRELQILRSDGIDFGTSFNKKGEITALLDDAGATMERIELTQAQLEAQAATANRRRETRKQVEGEYGRFDDQDDAKKRGFLANQQGKPRDMERFYRESVALERTLPADRSDQHHFAQSEPQHTVEARVTDNTLVVHIKGEPEGIPDLSLSFDAGKSVTDMAKSLANDVAEGRMLPGDVIPVLEALADHHYAQARASRKNTQKNVPGNREDIAKGHDKEGFKLEGMVADLTFRHDPASVVTVLEGSKEHGKY